MSTPRPELPPHARILELAMGLWVTQAVAEVAKLGLPDLVAAGPRTVAELAAATGTSSDALRRLVRATEMLGVLAFDGEGRVVQSALSDVLRSDAPNSMRGVAVFMGNEEHHRAWGALGEAVRTGQPSFDHVYGKGFFEHCATDRRCAAEFDAAMTSFSRNGQVPTAAGFDWTGIRTLADVGGGHGALLASIVARNPGMRGLLCDQEHVLAGAGPVLRSFGVEDRVTCVPGSFFTSVPEGADAYQMAHILHDWSDDHCLQILGTIRRAARPGALLLVFELVLPSGAAPHPAKLLDLEMLTFTRGGRERTEAEYAALVARAGFRHTATIPGPGPMSILRCEAV